MDTSYIATCVNVVVTCFAAVAVSLALVLILACVLWALAMVRNSIANNPLNQVVDEPYSVPFQQNGRPALHRDE